MIDSLLPTSDDFTQKNPHGWSQTLFAVTLASCLTGSLIGCATPSDGFLTQNASPGAVSSTWQDDAATGTKTELTTRQQRQIELIAPILLESHNGPDDGRLLAAAQELLALQLDQSDLILEQALRSDQPTQVLAVLRAMISEQNTPAKLVQAAVEILPTAPQQVQETLWRLLAQHEADLLSKISIQAMDQSALLEHRLNAIGALGAFRTRDAADQLINLLDDDRQEPEAVTNATCDSLTRLTRLPYGNRPQTWRSWWVQARNQTREQWLVDQVQRLATERAELERELTVQQQRTRRIEQRVVETMRALFRALPSDVDQQLAPLPALLDDELSIVQEFAIERIRFISRDHDIPETVQNALAARLDDSVPNIRAQSAKLLYELNYPQLNELIAVRLPDETFVEVLATYIDLLAEQPTISALPALVQHINDPNLCDAACTAIWNTIENISDTDLDEALRASIQEAVNEAAATRTSPPLIRLLVYLADDSTDAALPYLDHDDALIRTAAAEALARRSDVQPLLDRATDPAIYPIVIRALSTGEANLSTLQQVLDQTPPTETTTTAWLEAINTVVSGLPGDQLISADNLLVQANIAPASRIGLLSRAASFSAEQLPIAPRTELTIRLAQLHLDRNQYAKAHQELETITATDAPAEVVSLKFKAALLAGHYTRAAEFQPNAQPWIELLSSIADSNEALAQQMQAEIHQRFGETLDGELKTQFDALSRQLNGDDQSAPAPAAGGVTEPASNS